MISTTSPARFSSRASNPTNPDRRDRGDRGDDFALGEQGLIVNPHGSEHAAKAARAIVLLEFGRHGAALDQADFVDRKPWQNSVRAPGAWVR